MLFLLLLEQTFTLDRHLLSLHAMLLLKATPMDLHNALFTIAVIQHIVSDQRTHFTANEV